MMFTMIFFCPEHHFKLELDTHRQMYKCEKGCTYPIIDNIPRFVSTNNYAKAFGAQWKSYQRTQLDSYTGKPISRERLERLVGGDLDIVSNQFVLEAGCGAGRFTEILLQSGARVLAADLSVAVEANYGNCHHYENYAVIQADLLCLPVAPQQFDMVICIGVIQHTPNPEKTIEVLCGYVKPGGLLVIDHYSYNYPLTASRKFLRNYLIKTPPSFSIVFCRFLVAVLWPIHRLLWKYRSNSYIKRLRSKLVERSPVIDYHDAYAELGPELLFAWAMLDTHDTLTDYYKHLRSTEEIEAALCTAGMVDIETAYAGNGVEARARKPSLTK
jgi:SAM-dependent methyltransferase